MEYKCSWCNHTYKGKRPSSARVTYKEKDYCFLCFARHVLVDKSTGQDLKVVSK